MADNRNDINHLESADPEQSAHIIIPKITAEMAAAMKEVDGSTPSLDNSRDVEATRTTPIPTPAATHSRVDAAPIAAPKKRVPQPTLRSLVNSSRKLFNGRSKPEEVVLRAVPRAHAQLTNLPPKPIKPTPLVAGVVPKPAREVTKPQPTKSTAAGVKVIQPLYPISPQSHIEKVLEKQLVQPVSPSRDFNTGVVSNAPSVFGRNRMGFHLHIPSYFKWIVLTIAVVIAGIVVGSNRYLNKALKYTKVESYAFNEASVDRFSGWTKSDETNGNSFADYTGQEKSKGVANVYQFLHLQQAIILPADQTTERKSSLIARYTKAPDEAIENSSLLQICAKVLNQKVTVVESNDPNTFVKFHISYTCKDSPDDQQPARLEGVYIISKSGLAASTAFIAREPVWKANSKKFLEILDTLTIK